MQDVQDVVMADFPDVYRLLFKLLELPLPAVVVLKIEGLVSSVECTHLILAQPGNHVPGVRLKADDVQLVQVCGCDLAPTLKR